jgi:hypothetical protein
MHMEKRKSCVSPCVEILNQQVLFIVETRQRLVSTGLSHLSALKNDKIPANERPLSAQFFSLLILIGQNGIHGLLTLN